MFVRTLALAGAAAALVGLASTDAGAFGRHHHRGGKIETCYKKVVIPPVYKTVMQRVMVRPPSCAQYRTPPTYGTVAQEVVVQPERQVVHSKPAVYGRVEVQKMVRPARTRWKRSRCHDGYRCAVTTPPKYRTRTKRVLMEPAQRWVETRPAVKSVVRKQVVLDSGEVKQVCQPAEYKIVPTQVMVSPGTEQWVLVSHSGHAQAYHQPGYTAPEYRPAMRMKYEPMK